MQRSMTVFGVIALAVAFSGCGGGGTKPAAGGGDAGKAGTAAPAATPAATPAADETTYKCGGCGTTKPGKKAGPAPVCCGKPMTAA